MSIKVGIFPNLEKEKVIAILDEIIDFCKSENVEVFLPEQIAEEKKCKSFIVGSDTKKVFDVGISLGGDGTFLHMAHVTYKCDIPVCGINIGRKGFLTEIEVVNIKRDLKKIFLSQFTVEKRSLLRCVVERENKVIADDIALNDVVLSKGSITKLVRFSLNIDNSQKATYYSADGVIFSTATGSTAYSLSAGGPIVHPSLDVTIITPVCPHSLYTRPLIVPSDNEVVVKIIPPYSNIVLANDGILIETIEPYDTIRILKSSYEAKFIRVDNISYYDTWQDRLKKGEEV